MSQFNDHQLLELELNALLNVSNDNIVITDGSGIILRASSNCKTIYGVAQSALIGKSVYELEKERIFSPSVSAKVLKERKEVQVMQQTKTDRIVMATGIPVFHSEGDIVRIISFSHDLTEIEQLKEKYNALQERMKRYETEIEELRNRDEATGDIVVKSDKIKHVRELVQRVAKSDATVMFFGESGVGKNIFAHALHQASERKNEPFIEVNCSAIPETLFEAEMFGYESGSFTGASKKGKPGMVELAHKGTLFLDEVAELPLAVQAKLLKVIQEKKVIRVGGTQSRKVDFRLVAATNQNLEEQVNKGEFREDLYYRLHVIPIPVPPLRDRAEDIVVLIHHYLEKFNNKYRTEKSFLPASLDVLLNYRWPGNVRELENMVERLVITIEGHEIAPEHLPSFIQYRNSYISREKFVAEQRQTTFQTLAEELAAVEKKWFMRAYQQYKTTYKIAEHLGMSQPTVVRRLKKYKIDSKRNH